MMLMQFFSDFLSESICCWYLFELPRQIKAIQMSTHNIVSYKAINKSIISNLKTKKLLDCALIGVCAVIRSNTVCFHGEKRKTVCGCPHDNDLFFMVCLLIHFSLT